jgi:hypothetical protein
VTNGLQTRSSANRGTALALVGLFSLSALAHAAENGAQTSKPREAKDPTRASSVDDELLNDLNNELLKDAGDLRGTGKRKPAQPQSAKDGDPSRAHMPSEGEDVDMSIEKNDPLAHISDEMRSLEELIPKMAGRAHAEELQRRVVDDLARLIEQAEAQRRSQQPSSKSGKSPPSSQGRQAVKQPKPGASGHSSQDSNKPAQDSTDRLGQAKSVRPDAEALKGMMKDSWGHLPPKAREQMLQSSPERFLPQYELLIEKYYQRLAEEQRSK